jgi:ABC-type uncharacterized transport system permease subunit
MSQASLQQLIANTGAFRMLVVAEVVVFFVAAALHTGAFGVPRLAPAMIVEALCGIACVVLAYAMFTHQTWAAPVGIQIGVLVAVLLGLFFVSISPSLRTPLNYALHGIMIVLIAAALSLLTNPATRAALKSKRA